MREKYDAVEFFRPFLRDLASDHSYSSVETNSVLFLDKYAYAGNFNMMGQLRIYDKVPRCALMWLYNEEFCTDLTDAGAHLIQSFSFSHEDGEVLFLRKKDIWNIGCNLSAFKRKSGTVRFEVGEDDVTVTVTRQKKVLLEKTFKKIFLQNKKVTESENYQGIFEVNLLYFTLATLENSGPCDIIGLRLQKREGAMTVFVRSEGINLNYVIKKVKYYQ